MPQLSEENQAVVDAITSSVIQAIDASNLDLERKIDKVQAQVCDILNGFPDRDLAGHRTYHEAAIEWRQTRNKLVNAALMQAAKVGSIAAIGWVAYAVWVALKMELTK